MITKYWTCPNCGCDNEWTEYLQCGNCLSEFLGDEVEDVYQVRDGHEWYTDGDVTKAYCRHCGQRCKFDEMGYFDKNVECMYEYNQAS